MGTSKPVVMEVPDIKIAAANEIFDDMDIIPRMNSASSVWTQYNAAHNYNEGGAQGFEGGEVTGVVPANVYEQDGFEETGAEYDGDMETGDDWDNNSVSAVEVDGDVETGDMESRYEWDTQSVNSASALEYVDTDANEVCGEDYDNMSPSACTFASSPTAAESWKRGPMGNRNVHEMFQHNYGGSQDLSGFDDSPSAVESVHGKRMAKRFFTEELEDQWGNSTGNSVINPVKRTISNTQSFTFDEMDENQL